MRRSWLVAAGLLGLATIAALVLRAWLVAQLRTLVVLVLVADAPVLGTIARHVTDAPVVQQRPVAGVPAAVAVPAGGGPYAAVVVMNGVTARGRHESHVERFTAALGRTGYLAVVPDVPGLSRGELTERTLRGTRDVVRSVAAWPKVARVSVLGGSVGGSLALVAASAPDLAGRVSSVVAIAPYTDLRGVIELATTGVYPAERGPVPYRAKPFLDLVVARSLIAGLPPGRERDRLLSRLARVPHDAPRPLRALRRLDPRGFGVGMRAVLELLRNDRPARFAARYRRLPESLRAGVAALSPVTGAARLWAPVEIASAREDKYFPPEQYPPLLALNARIRLTDVPPLRHTIPSLSPGGIAGLARLDGFGVRVMRGLALPVRIDWPGAALAFAGLLLVGAQGFRRGRLIGAAGLAAWLAALPALFETAPIPLACSAAAALLGAAVTAKGTPRRWFPKPA